MSSSAPDPRLLRQAVALGLVEERDAEECFVRCAAVVAAARAGRLTQEEFVAAASAAMEPMLPALERAIAVLAAAGKPGGGGDGA